jgi:1-acyl-sn-glycerol-3-phosphate acyltransferase
MEVLRWPIFGLAGAMAGTVFVDRSRTAVGSAAIARVEEVLREGVCVVLFPEGTSTDGSRVLKFYSSFFEPAVQSRAIVTAAAIAYPDGADYVEKDLCYYDNITFFPRLFKTLCLKSVLTRLDFAADGNAYNDRKTAAARSREEVVMLRAAQIDSFRGEEDPMGDEEPVPLV